MAVESTSLTSSTIWVGLLNDLTSRGALAGALAGIYGLTTVFWWILHVRRVDRRASRIPVRVLVAGSRGKSSMVRLLHSALSSGGLRVAAKTTGTAARFIEPDGREHATVRLGQVSILETLPFMEHAGRLHVDAVVTECMAVKPELIRQLSADIVHPTIVNITNSDIDHLEEEGADRQAIMRSLAQAVTHDQVVITGEDEPDCIWELQQQVHTTGGKLITVDPRMSLDGGGESLVPHAYPDNVAMVLAVTRACGISDELAIAGMRRATHEPEEEEIIDGVMAGVGVRFCNIGSINDANNVLPAVHRVLGPRSVDVPRLALLSGRSDRPLRAMLFAGLVPQSEFDGVVVSGGPESMVVAALHESGWPSDRVIRLGSSVYLRRLASRVVVRFVRRLAPKGRSFELIAMENIHVLFAATVRRDLVAQQRRAS